MEHTPCLHYICSRRSNVHHNAIAPSPHHVVDLSLNHGDMKPLGVVSQIYENTTPSSCCTVMTSMMGFFMVSWKHTTPFLWCRHCNIAFCLAIVHDPTVAYDRSTAYIVILHDITVERGSYCLCTRHYNCYMCSAAATHVLWGCV